VAGAYVLAFGAVLPAALWKSGRALDVTMGWRATPSVWGYPVLLGGLVLLLAGIVQLAREGRGLPVSALPPPQLARRGLYRHVRHPVYLGFNVAVFGGGLVAGSPGLAWVVAPAFAPLWVGYAWLEEKGLAKRFGRGYRRYRRRVGLLPRPPAYTVSRLVSLAWPVRVSGAEHVPARGAAVLVANHCCYLDPLFLGRATMRRVHFLATAEAYRAPVARAYMRCVDAVPVRRYRSDPSACREVQCLLDDGELVGLFPEGERSPLGAYEGTIPEVAAFLARLGVPVIPVGIGGSYDCGPRWAGIVRRGPVQVRVGLPLTLGRLGPGRVIDSAIRTLLDRDPQPLRWEGLPMALLARVLWRCPTCLDEPGWWAAALACSSCGTRYQALPGGWLADAHGHVFSLAVLGDRVRLAAETGPVRAWAEGAMEPSLWGPIRPLVPMGCALLSVAPDAVRFAGLRLPLDQLRNVSVEGASTLQLASATRMWQFRLLEGSAFRMRGALMRWVAGLPSAA
jgi:1-acyl-sn-glycerol-3-phosphate acyltransferase